MATALVAGAILMPAATAAAWEAGFEQYVYVVDKGWLTNAWTDNNIDSYRTTMTGSSCNINSAGFDIYKQVYGIDPKVAGTGFVCDGYEAYFGDMGAATYRGKLVYGYPGSTNVSIKPLTVDW